MRERSAERVRSQRGGARGGARTMLRCLCAHLLLLTAADAWRPPVPMQPLLLQPHALHRQRRTVPSTTRLQLLGWQLELQENLAIRSPYYDVCKFYRGRIVDEEDSSATVTECGGELYGLLQAGGEEFVLQPAAAQEGAHVLRRRDVLVAESAAEFQLSGDTVPELELDLEEEAARPHVHPRHYSRSDVEYMRDVLPAPITRPLSDVQELWLEMAIVADHTMLKLHGRDRVKYYILALMNIVSAIFNDPSLNSNMTLVINKLYEEKDPVLKYGNVKKTLEAVNKWNYRHLMKLPPGVTGWDIGVWLTRSQLGGPSGFAPVGGVCSRTRSAAIVRDEGLTSAFVIAHEIGHLLGLTHDGEADCQTDALRKSVMAPTVLATLHNYTWSKCSREQFHEKSGKWWCLLERSGEEGVELVGTRELANFTMDEQCRTEFGEGFSVCKSVKVRSACTRLWCAHRLMPHVCRSKRAPPVEGTPCGRNRWCVNRVCELMPGHEGEKTTEEKPKWDSWSDWSPCSADCGYGLRTRRRHCRYKGSISEGSCEGASSQAVTCWAGVACASRDIRADLCMRQSRHLIPYLHPEQSKQCEMWCMDYVGGEANTLGALPDGSPCSYERPYDICFQGTCVQGQCNASDPVCNWCPDGFCNNNTHFYIRQLSKGWTRIAVIPHEAHLLSVHIATPIALHIALRERKREKHILELSKHSKRFEVEQNNYLKYDPSVPQNLQIVEVDSNVIDIKEGEYGGWEGRVVAAGSQLKWRQTDTDVFITATSRLQTDLMIMAIPEYPVESSELVSVEVAVNYSTPAGRTKPLEYRWATSHGACSASCGGGVRIVRPRCLRGDSCGSPVYEPCNMHSCEFKWVPGEWEGCSATCGTSGVQERQLFCLPANVSVSTKIDIIRNSVSPALCPAIKPEMKQSCNMIPCPVYWQEMPWTPCSATCGRGISRRPLVCPASDEVLCGPRPRERRRRCRLRRCPSLRPPPCHTPDTAQYCELFKPEHLIRNCVVPPFRKVCCNACRNVELIENKDAG